jgi:hypothetical protein
MKECQLICNGGEDQTQVTAVFVVSGTEKAGAKSTGLLIYATMRNCGRNCCLSSSCGPVHPENAGFIMTNGFRAGWLPWYELDTVNVDPLGNFGEDVGPCGIPATFPFLCQEGRLGSMWNPWKM